MILMTILYLRIDMKKWKTFDSYHELLEFHQDFCDKELMPLFTKINTETIEYYNKRRVKKGYQPLDKSYDKFVYSQVTFQCKHYGNYETKAIQKQTKTSKLDCKAFIKYSFNLKMKRMVIVQMELNHNHDLEIDTYEKYPENRLIRKASPELICEIKSAMNLGSNIKKT